MPEKTRHVPLRDAIWSADEAARAIDKIVSDALAYLDAERFWPAHPLDDGVSDGNTSFYFGATGVMWALEYLRRVGATRADFDLRPSVPRLIEANRAEFASGPYPAHGSFLFGDLGTGLLAMRLSPTPAIADISMPRGKAISALRTAGLCWA